MDKGRKIDWSWMATHMPEVVRMLKEERRRGGGQLIDDCWKRGVHKGEAGWFYAHENSVSVGVPSPELLADPTLQEISRLFPGRALLMLNGRMCDAAPPAGEGRHGA